MKQFTLTGEQAMFFHNALNNPTLCPFKDLSSMRKVHKVFDSLSKIVDDFENLRKKFEEPKMIKDAQGNEVETLQIPTSKRKEYDEAQKPLNKKTHTISCEREALTFAKVEFGAIPKRMYKEKDKENNNNPSGFGGSENVKMFVEVMDALEDAKKETK